MPRFYGLINVDTLQKSVHQHDFGSRLKNKLQLECGNYRFWAGGALPGPAGFWHDESELTIHCEACNGTGGEEISGGHKKYCEECLGSGIDPVLLKEFEKAPDPLVVVRDGVDARRVPDWSRIFSTGGRSASIIKCCSFHWYQNVKAKGPPPPQNQI